MPLLVNSVPNLIQGVSQQPDSLRHPSQCEEQINAFSSVVDGLIKRQSTEFVGKISDDASNASSLFTHFVKRDEDTKYCVTVSLGGVGVFNLSLGTHIPVAVTSIAGSYLSLGSSVTNPLTDLRALTVADYTFLVNKKRVVEKEPTKSRVPKDEAILVVRMGDFNKNYTVILDDVVIPHVFANGLKHSDAPTIGATNATYQSASASHPEKVDTNVIAHDLALIIKEALEVTNNSVLGLTINSSTASGWAGGRSTGEWVHTSPNGTNFTYHYKLELEITQGSAGKASCELIVKNGVIVGVDSSTIKRGRNFNYSAGDITLTYKQMFWSVRYDGVHNDGFRGTYGGVYSGWQELQPGDEFYFSPPTTNGDFTRSTPNGATTDPIHVRLQTLSGGGYEVNQKGSVISIKSLNGPFNVRVQDGLGDQGLSVAYKEVNSVTELPVKCYNQFGPLKVVGDADIDQDDYYVTFSTKDKTDFGEGSWVETVGYYQDETQTSRTEGIETTINNSTLPLTLMPYFNNSTVTDFRLSSPNDIVYVKRGSSYYKLDKDHAADGSNEPGGSGAWEDYWSLVDESYNSQVTVGYLPWRLGTYYYKPPKSVGWLPRQAGDDSTNPFPSFIGKTINDIFFFKNRLGILTDSSVIFSEADEYFNFFRTTTQQLLDSAPIDVGLSHTKVAILKHAKAFQEKLMLFSDTSQFVLRGQDVLSPKTVAISPVSEYDVSDQVEPLALGNYIYFPFKRDNYEGLYEYFVDNNTEVFTAQEVTEQVPRYIRSNVQRMAGSPIQNVICLKSDRGTEQDTLYVYKYFWSNNEKVQSAWQKFEFGHCTNICGFEFIDSTLYMLNHVGDVLQLEKLSFEDGHTETIHGFHSYRGDLGYPILLDSKIAQGVSAYTTQSYDALTNKTTISDVDIYIPESNESYELQLWTMNGAKYDITKGSEIPDELVHDGITYTAVDSGPSGLKVEIYPSPSSDMTYNSGTKTLVISLPSPITDRTQGDIKALYDAASANETDVFNLSFSDPNATLTSYLDPTPLIRVSDSSFTVDGPIYDYVSYEGTIYKCNLSHNSGFYPETSANPDNHKPGGDQPFWDTLSGDEAVLVTSAPEWQEDRWYQGPNEFVIGYAYGMLYRFSKQTLKQPTERGGRTKSDYTFQTIRTGSLEYSGSGAMQVEVYPKFRDPKRYPFNPTNLGSDSIINKFTPESGHFRFPIQTQAEELRLEVKNSSALPLRLLSAEFESMVVSRSKRYGA